MFKVRMNLQHFFPALLLLVFSSNGALGSVIILGGTTSGTFATGVSGMTFTGGDFIWATDPAGSASVNLGTLSWGTSSVYQVDNALSLTVDFTNPTAALGSKVFTADIWASWNGFSGFCDVWFDDVDPTHFSYAIPTGTGSFDLSIAGTVSNGKSWGTGDTYVLHRWFSIPVNGSVPIMGQITNAIFTPIPEPVSICLFVVGGMSLLIGRCSKR